MAKNIIILIDGGYLRVRATKAGKTYNPAFIENLHTNAKLLTRKYFASSTMTVRHILGPHGFRFREINIRSQAPTSDLRN
jgi:hypothetical protein